MPHDTEQLLQSVVSILHAALSVAGDSLSARAHSLARIHWRQLANTAEEAMRAAMLLVSK